MGQLGDILRERRVNLRITLEQAEDATKIRAKLLTALEAGEYGKLPNPGYVRGYITSYARYLELDSVPLLAMYRAETGAGRFHEVALPDEAVRPRAEQHAVPWKAGVGLVVGLGIVSLLIWGVVRLNRGPDKPPPIPTTSLSSDTPASTATVDASMSPAARPANKPVATFTPFSLRIVAAQGQASWLVVTVDGRSAYTGSLTGGRAKEFQVTKQAVIKFGRPTAVTVYRDGKQIAVPNGAGTPTLTLKADLAP